MKKINPNQREIGVYFPEGGRQAEACVWAPLAERVELLIDKNSGKYPLEQDEFGYWYLSTGALQPGDRYAFLIDGEKERPDPASLHQPEGVHKHSEAVDTRRFRWSDQQWRNPPLD